MLLEFEVEFQHILLCRIFVSCSKLALEKVPIIRKEVTNNIMEALDHAPSIVIFDDLDSIISTSDSEGSQPSMSAAGLAGFLVDIIDEYEVRKLSGVFITFDFLRCYVQCHNLRCMIFIIISSFWELLIWMIVRSGKIKVWHHHR